jgi:bisphosphoglycerate-independent phosphoglycerate mutase (AlkP superfamily)
MVVSTGRSVRFHEGALRDDPEASAWLDRGARARPWPGDGDYRPDRFTAPLALRYLESARPRFLFLSLGDTDEYAHHGDYAGYLDALHAADETIGAIVDALDRMGPRGRNTTLYVTADHGRARDFRDHGGRFPESSRVWLVAIGGGVKARGPLRARGGAADDDGGDEHRLADVAPSIRQWLGLEADLGPDGGRVIRELL